MRLTRILSKVKSEEFRYWHRFVERQRRKYMGLEVHNHQTGYKTVQKKRWYYDEHRPWTVEAATANRERTRVPDILIEPVKKQKLFKGDIVRLLQYFVMAGDRFPENISPEYDGNQSIGL